LTFCFLKKYLSKQMKKAKRILISRSSDYSGGGFGFTLRHFVIYPPSVSVNDILQVNFDFQNSRMIISFIHHKKYLDLKNQKIE
jgi:hypothetical protein